METKRFVAVFGVEDRTGKVRKLVLQGYAKERTALLPAGWKESLRKEVEFQISQEKAKAEGRWVPSS